jgi:hypothetical protein
MSPDRLHGLALLLRATLCDISGYWDCADVEYAARNIERALDVLDQVARDLEREAVPA